jgi:hypothetical protein
MKRLSRILVTALVSAPVFAAFPRLLTAQDPATTDSAAWWRETARKDLAAARDIMDTRFIVALNSPGAEWDHFLGDATQAAERDIARIRDAAGYQSVMQHFANAFDDAHVRIAFPRQRVLDHLWAGFLVRYKGNQFTVVESERPDVKVGSAVTGCDAKPIDQVLTEILPYEHAPQHLEVEAARSALARVLFVHAANSLRPRPTRCRIAGYDIPLDWKPIANDKLARLDSTHGSYRNRETSIETWGRNGAWVRMPTMGPSGESARQFARIIERAPTLRNREVVVIDVRGNGGGSYNWFAGFLDSLYGPEYARFYARARVQFANIMSNLPPMQGGGRGQPQQAGRGAGGEPARPPVDGVLGTGGSASTRPGAHGTTLQVLDAADVNGGPAGPPPGNPVRARVFLLTDNGCASACISFTDEMRRFPGVFQIGRDTYVDSYPGSPTTYTLPSGEASISAPSMTREVRQRGSNFAWKPDVYFEGDIRDTEAIRRWISDVLMKR